MDLDVRGVYLGAWGVGQGAPGVDLGVRGMDLGVLEVAAEMSLSEGTALERSNQQILMATDDAGEGLDAFLSKRQPKFKGS